MDRVDLTAAGLDPARIAEAASLIDPAETLTTHVRLPKNRGRAAMGSLEALACPPVGSWGHARIVR